MASDWRKRTRRIRRKAWARDIEEYEDSCLLLIIRFVAHFFLLHLDKPDDRSERLSGKVESSLSTLKAANHEYE